MKKSKLTNIIAQAVKPSRFSVMVNKVKKRLFDRKGQLSHAENMNWIKNECSSFEDYAATLNKDMWESSCQTCDVLQKHAQEVLNNIEYNLGGGGCYPLLHFLTIYLAPDVIIETGVAAGFSSYAVLKAIDESGKGVLYSSDFPYFRLPDPESFIGIVIEEHLKKDWRLFIEGDEVNLPKIISEVQSVDLFHYDSDKSYSGREYAMNLLVPRMSEKGIIVMDDIQVNSFFHDYVSTSDISEWKVFEYAGKYVGLIGAVAH